MIVLEFPISNGTSRLDWKVSPEFGDHVIRFMNREGEVVSTQWVRNGERSPPVSLEGLSQGDFLSRFLRYMEIGFTHNFAKGTGSHSLRTRLVSIKCTLETPSDSGDQFYCGAYGNSLPQHVWYRFCTNHNC